MSYAIHTPDGEIVGFLFLPMKVTHPVTVYSGHSLPPTCPSPN